jgi:hypothetical protein
MSERTASGRSSMTVEQAAANANVSKILLNDLQVQSMYGVGDVKLPEKPLALRADLLREAEDITCGDRHMDYGDPVINHDNIAKIASIAIGKELTAHDVVMVLIAAKMARARISPTKRDHYVDIMAYAGIAYECAVDGMNDD